MKTTIKSLASRVRAYSKPNRIQPDTPRTGSGPDSSGVRHRCGMPARRMHRIDPARLDRANGR